MIRSHYKVADMDCPSELNLIKMKLGPKALQLDADFDKRELWVTHTGQSQEISASLSELKLGSEWLSDADSSLDIRPSSKESSKLWAVLILNFSFFLIEVGAFIWSGSMALAADGLDMLADALVYGLSLWALNRGIEQQKNIAKSAGYLQIGLALLGFSEVIRRAIGLEEPPEVATMIAISSAALVANALSLYLLRSAKSTKTAMKASMIFTSNDILINLGVILGAGLVYFLESAWPDLVIGSLVFMLVLWGARRILALAK